MHDDNNNNNIYLKKDISNFVKIFPHRKKKIILWEKKIHLLSYEDIIKKMFM